MAVPVTFIFQLLFTRSGVLNEQKAVSLMHGCKQGNGRPEVRVMEQCHSKGDTHTLHENGGTPFTDVIVSPELFIGPSAA